MIEIKDLTYTYPEAENAAVRDISLHIKKGECVLFVGPSGSGKSTVLYCLNGLIPHIFAGNVKGSVTVEGISPQGVPIAELSKTVGTVFQNHESQIFMPTVEEDVAFGCENLLMARDAIIGRRDAAIEAMGLQDVRYAGTDTLSGGMKQRLAISSIYAMGPRLFLFDEPTADLDEEGRRDLVGILKKLKAAHHTIIVAEHRYDDLLPVADRVLFFEKGRVTEGVRKAGKGSSAAGGTNRAGNGAPHIELRNISFGYNRKAPVLENISLKIEKGEMVAICGNNGSGKTTLLKVMAAILRPVSGEAVIGGITNPALDDIVGSVGFLFQNPDEQLFTGSVEEELMFGPKRLGKKIDVGRYLKVAGLDSMMRRHPQTLSRGQRQLLAVLSVLAMEPQILLLDEPTTGLDDGTWHDLFRILRELTCTGRTVVFSTHHRRARELSDRVIALDRKGVTADAVF